MARRFGVLVLALLILGPWMSRSSSVGAANEPPAHVAVLAEGKTGKVDVQTGDTVKLDAVVSRDLELHEYFQIRNLSTHENVETCRESPCVGSVTQKSEKTMVFQAFLVTLATTKTPAKVLAKSNKVTVTWKKQFTLSLSATADATAPGSTDADVQTYEGLPVTMSVSAPDGESAEWTDVYIVESDADGSNAKEFLDCQGTADNCFGEDRNPPWTLVTKHFRVLAFVGTQIAATSNLISVTYHNWTVELTVNGAQNDVTTVTPTEKVTLEATTTEPKWSDLPGHYYSKPLHIGFVEVPGQTPFSSLEDCAPPKPCSLDVDPPAPGEPTKLTYMAWVGPTPDDTEPSPSVGDAQASIQYKPAGYKFTLPSFTYSETQTACTPGFPCGVIASSSSTITISGVMCGGDPYANPWTFMVDDAIDSQDAVEHTDTKIDQKYHFSTAFDPNTEEATDTGAYADIVPGFGQYVHLYLRGTVDPETGDKTPNTMELSLDVPDGQVDYTTMNGTTSDTHTGTGYTQHLKVAVQPLTSADSCTS